ncbi:hypothetical protein MPER_04259, partial [Moniliophthora perniciosa FA553]
LFGALFGYAIIKAISKALPESGLLGKLFGGPFGPKENCTVQTAATAAGGMSGLFVSTGTTVSLTSTRRRTPHRYHQTYLPNSRCDGKYRSRFKGKDGAIIAKKTSLAL